MNYQNITTDDMVNGDGLRVVLWVSGCEHKCKNCQNTITWNPEDGILFDSKVMHEIENELKNDYISGITFSGGDPLHKENICQVANFILYIKHKYPNKTIWLYTGYKWEYLSERYECNMTVNSSFINSIKYILPCLDVLVDGKFEDVLKDDKYHWAGSTNQRVIDVQKTLKTGEVILWDQNSKN